MERHRRVVVDIETLAYPIEAFDDAQRTYLLKFAVTGDERTEALLRLNLSPLTARIIAVGMLNPDTRQGKVFYEHPGGTASMTNDGLVGLIPGTETEILSSFWAAVAHYPRIITFNGRAFDGPFLMLRSALLGVTPTRNLVPYRFSAAEHCDLLDQLTYYGTTRRFNLDFYCKAFGIPSPKEGGITGLDMGPLVAEGRYREIAEYCLGDIRATAELFRRWEAYLSFERRGEGT
ncbi:MAG: ribonuclease H-like domain-containing protein [Bacteroidota bacterium]